MSDKLRFLCWAPGQTWSGWALFDEGRLLESGIALSEPYLDAMNQEYLAKLDLFNRRLLGLRRSIEDVLDRHAPVDTFVAWTPSATSTVGYASRAGQYVGIMKSVCFERGIPVIDVNDDEGRAVVGISPETAREELEEAVIRRLGNSDLPSEVGTYDSGVSYKATPIDAITIGWVAQARLWKATQSQ